MKRIAIVNSRWNRQPPTESPRAVRKEREVIHEGCPVCRSALDFLDCPYCS
jgi:hypothetical protein